MWWWQDLASLEDFSVAYDGDETMRATLARQKDEAPYRFTPTQN
jgi:hypothetical protein